MPSTLPDDDDFGRRLRPYLDTSAASLPDATVLRLRLARAAAMERRHAHNDKLVMVGGTHLAWQRMINPSAWRSGLLIVLLVASSGWGGWQYHQQQQRDSEVEQDVSTLMGAPSSDVSTDADETP